LAVLWVCLFAGVSRAQATFYLWDGGGGDGNWYTAANWNPDGVPGASDDVLIPAADVSVSASSPAVQVRNLTIGNGVGAAGLRLSTGVVGALSVIVRTNSSLVFAGTQPVNASALTVESGGLITHDGPLALSTAAVTIQAQTFDVQAGGSVSVSGKGFTGGAAVASGFGPGFGVGSTNAADGAGHAQTGGIGGGSGNSGGTAYGSAQAPAQHGSGGGGALAPCYGGAGGGLIRIEASTWTLNGTVSADGTDGVSGCLGGGGGGSGGAVYASAYYIVGAGTVSVRGGIGGNGTNFGGGGGSGGRTAVFVSGNNDSRITLLAASGSGGSGALAGTTPSAGSTFFSPKLWVGAAGDGSFCSNGANWVGYATPQAGESVIFGSTNSAWGCIWDISASVIIGSVTLRPEYSGLLRLGTAVNVSGAFSVSGGTVSMTIPLALAVGGNMSAQGTGRFDLNTGSVTLNGASPQTLDLLSGSTLQNLLISPGAQVSIPGYLSLRGNFTAQAGSTVSFPSATLFVSSGDVRGLGQMDFNPAHRLQLLGLSTHTLLTRSVGTLRVSGPAGVSLPASSSMTFQGDLIIDTGAALSGSTAYLNIYGDWRNYGSFTLPGGTVCFAAPAADQHIYAGAQFPALRADKAAGTLWISTTAQVSDSLQLAGGVLDLGVRRHSIEGDILQSGGSLAASASTVTLDGTVLQTVSLLSGTSFHHLISSNSAVVRFSSDVAMTGNLRIDRGVLDFSTVTVFIGGDFVDQGSIPPAVARSTVVLDGTSRQLLRLKPSDALAGLTVLNAGAGVLLQSTAAVRGNLRVASGARFDGGAGVLNLDRAGNLWDTAGAEYSASGPHVIQWSSQVYVAAGSTVSGCIVLSSRVDLSFTGQPSGALNLAGSGALIVNSGATLAAASSTITLRGTADLVFASTGTRYLYDAASWIVYEGSGPNRALSLSTGPFMNLRLSPQSGTDSFALKDVVLAGSLLLERGILRSSHTPLIEVRGNVRNLGGVVDLSAITTSTLRMAGAAQQGLSLLAGDRLWNFEAKSSSRVQVESSTMDVYGSLLLSSGVFNAGSALLHLEGDWQGNGLGLFEAGSSTVALLAVSSAARQNFSDPAAPSFNGLRVSVATAVFSTAFSAKAFTADKPRGWIYFVPGSTSVFRVEDFRVNGTSLTTRIRLRGTSAGSRWNLQVVSFSSVTCADISYSSAATGLAVQANDGRSIDSGQNVNWNFKAALVLLAPGEAFTQWAGKSGTPIVRTAGVPFQVTVRAVSSSYGAVASTLSVTFSADDPFAEGFGSHPLSAGTTQFDVTLKVAEPSPRTAQLSVSGSQFFGVGGASVDVLPTTYTRLQVILPGEDALPGSPAGKIGYADPQTAGKPFTLTVRAVDRFSNLIDTAPADTVVLDSIASSTVDIPAPQILSAGQTAFSGLNLFSTGTYSVRAYDQDDGLITPNVSSTFSVFFVNFTSPVVSISIPVGASLPTLAGRVTGTASDQVALARVEVFIRDNSADRFFDWNAQTFSSILPVAGKATLSPPNGRSVVWSIGFDDAGLTEGRSYYVLARSSNPSGFQSLAESTFTFAANRIIFGAGDGQGSATVAPSTWAACMSVVSTVTYTVGSGGIGPGGALALRVPDGWTEPRYVTQADPPLGGVAILSTSTVWSVAGSSEVLSAPAMISSVTLGPGWIAVRVKSNALDSFKPGEQIRFVYHGRPPGRPLVGAQSFELRSQGTRTGALNAIGVSPSLDLQAGPAGALAFTEYSPLALGPLQTSPTLQLRVTDVCGNPVSAPASAELTLRAGVHSSTGFAVDDQAEFFLSGGGSISSVLLPAGERFSESFYYRTSTAGISLEHVRATATISGSPAQAERAVVLLSSAALLQAVSIDTGSLASGATSAVLSAGASGAQVRVSFSLPDPRVEWELSISTDASASSTVLFSAAGAGDAARPIVVSWNGVVCPQGEPCRFAAPGAYSVRLRAAGGADIRVLEVRVPASASVYGSVGEGAAGAFIRASGSGAGVGAFTVADSTGFFQLFGLLAGERYDLTISTLVSALGQGVYLSTVAADATASAAGTDLGTLTMPQPSFLRVSVLIPVLAPVEFWGNFHAAASDGSSAGSGALHFSSGSAVSDDGAQALGRSASTWTVLALPPGSYDGRLVLSSIGISTWVHGISVPEGGIADLRVILSRKANVSGWAILPSTASAGTSITVQALRQGSQSPEAFAEVFVASSSAGLSFTSGTYTLYGLDPGSWTLQAYAPNWRSTSAAVFISSDADIGDGRTGAGGVDLRLEAGLILTGTVTVSGDSSAFGGRDGSPGFLMVVDAYEASRFAHASIPVRLSTSAVLASSTFSLTGLEAGTWRLSASLDGFDAASVLAAVSSAAPNGAQLTLVRNFSRLRLDILLPSRGACRSAAEFKSVGLHISGPKVDLPAVGDITSLMGSAGVEESFFCTSMTFLSPPLDTGLYRVRAAHGPSGNWKELFLSLSAGATAQAVADLSGATYAVSGFLSLAGPVSFQSSGYSVSVSSLAGLLAQSAATSYCLLSSSMPVQSAGLHLELLPLDSFGGLAPAPLRPSTGACSSYAVVPGAEGLPSLLGYIAQPSADGSFRFGSVAPGTYLLRSSREIDGRSEDGEELSEASTLVRVEGDSQVQLRIGAGLRLSGRISLPLAGPLDRPVGLRLLDGQGQVVRSQLFVFNEERDVSFAFEKLAAGRYSLVAEDAGFPRVYAARPVQVELQAADAEEVLVALSAAGAIKGRLALQRQGPDGSRESVVVSQGNRALLPAALDVRAAASPWIEGGLFSALRDACGSENCPLSLDADGRFLISGVIPGLYDVEVAAGAEYGGGALSLAADSVGGVSVAGGATADIGVLSLRTAAVLSGFVREAGSGRALANIRVEARESVRAPGRTNSRRVVPAALTDAQGRYILAGLDPEIRYYDVVAAPRTELRSAQSAPDHAQETAPAVDVASTSVLDFSLDPAPYSLRGRVVGAGGLELFASLGDGSTPGAAVFVQKQGVIPTLHPLGDIVSYSDEQGRFTVSGLGAGVYRVTAAARGFADSARTAKITAASVDLGTMTLSAGGAVSGALRKADGTRPGEDEVAGVYAATAGMEETFAGTLVVDPNSGSVSDYRVSGLRAGTPYRLLFIGREGGVLSPAEAREVTLASGESERALDVVLLPGRPQVRAKSRRQGADFLVDFLISEPLRARTADDDDPLILASTFSAAGAITGGTLSQDRRRVSVIYHPSVGESSFTLRLAGYAAQPDPENPPLEYRLSSTFTFYAGLDAYNRAMISNLAGGGLALETEPSRVSIPKGAFYVDASSSVEVVIQRAEENSASRGLSALRYGAASYPQNLRRALAAVPPDVRPLSAFYDLLLPLGVRAALARPAQLTVQYSTGADPSKLNLYWYNPAANAYVLQQDVTGASPVIDAANRTYTLNVGHFSTFVLFENGAAVISGDGFHGGQIEAFNFPNPFDLQVKSVTPIHGDSGHASFQNVRGTMIRIAVPPGVQGEGRIHIFNVAGERVRTLEMGALTGGQFYYEAWDGRNDSGRDVASGVYVGQVKIGGKSQFFKMALIK
jgi:hypothetical protein